MFSYSKLVLDWHGARTAANSAAYLLISIRPEMHVVIIGYGSGSITADLAVLVPQPSVTGINVEPEAIGEACIITTRRGLRNVTFTHFWILLSANS